MKGKVYLVGAGPGDPELLTLKALRLLRSADVVLHDELIGQEILKLIPDTTFVRNVGKRGGRRNIRQQEIDTLLVKYASQGLTVVRLKGGDPLIFGRAGEEIEALRGAHIEFEIVPGISAMSGAAAAIKIPLTHRAVSSALVLLTGHSSIADGPHDWPNHISEDATVAVYMPGHDYAATYQHLVTCGLKKSTPCAVISKATTSDQEIFVTTLQNLAFAPKLPAPKLLVVGNVVQFVDQSLPIEKVTSLEIPSSNELVTVPLLMQGQKAGDSELQSD